MKNLGEIDTNRIEGRLLIAALTILTTTERLVILREDVNGSSMEPDKMLQLVEKVADKIYENVPPVPEGEVEEKDFQKELSALINRHSQENESNTPDFLLAKFMHESLLAANTLVNRREDWYGVKHAPGQSAPRQSTDLTDKNGNEIFAGDPLFLKYESVELKGIARYCTESREWEIYKDEGNHVGISRNRQYIEIVEQ